MNPDVLHLAIETLRKTGYRKNLHYNFLGDSYYRTAKFFGALMQFAGPSGVAAWTAQQCYRKMGAQVQVSKAVSDDLVHSDFAANAKIENIPFIAPVMEFYFEDPKLPTVLVQKVITKDLEPMFPFIDMSERADEYINVLMQVGNNTQEIVSHSLQIRPEMYEEFLSEAKCPPMKMGQISFEITQADNAVMCFMLHLALKILVFASIPKYVPIKIAHKQMHWGGKPFLYGRPDRPAFRAEYLPKIVTYYPDHKPEPTGASREFYGRRGHIHWYWHERFVNRKGTWDYYPPIVDPVTGRYPEVDIFKVRKP